MVLRKEGVVTAQEESAVAFGVWLARQLKRRGMTQAELAGELGITRAGVSAWITGRAEPREEKKRAIAAVLGTDEATIHTLRADVPSARPVTWYHRRGYHDGGREFGNAATFAFASDVSVLAREATQNSLDERFDQTRPVRVRYVLHELSGTALQDFLEALRWKELLPHYEAAAAQEQRTGRAVSEGLRRLREAEPLVLLRVEDYNSFGLTGPEYDDGRFSAVVRRQLDSRKSTVDAGGSYGLGKATLWATSRLGLVLMNSTLAQQHEGRTEGRFIGRLDLPWRSVDGVAYAGPAWLGEADTEAGHEGVSRSCWADDRTLERLHLSRTDADPGTSFLIVGAHDASGDAETLEEMHEKLVRSLADNFWAAMTHAEGMPPLLSASVTTLRNGREVLPEEHVDPGRHQAARSRALRAWLEGRTVDHLTQLDQVALARVPLTVPPVRSGENANSVRHEAVLLVTPADGDDDEPNRIACLRGSRMVVEKRRVTGLPMGTSPFQAVLLAGLATGADDEAARSAEEFLRSSEPPEHDKWTKTEELTTRYVRGARTRLDEFRREMNARVQGLLGRREEKHSRTASALQELLEPDIGSAGRRPDRHPVVKHVEGELRSDGAFSVRVEVKLPPTSDGWLMSPVAKFDVRSGPKPSVDWAEIVPEDNCRWEGDRLRFAPGARRASFSGVTDVASHPVAGRMARLVVDLQKARG
ncbi:helix-turn-helix transcriptional regulator [Streptomyces albus]|uniref:XRE family transcriptional regulator n=1 Tax=Streptomyces albus TaxID=1888 RepID=A0A6C1C248_9ACTN|nr:DNA-binding protein [Streptomyces sp. NRRL F-6602]QID37064.1 helix-turn-helix transcriptional regulator [Streptomyces albus]TGG81707.1 XRE family transcriptional regulator [Streptomyces albus]